MSHRRLVYVFIGFGKWIQIREIQVEILLIGVFCHFREAIKAMARMKPFGERYKNAPTLENPLTQESAKLGLERQSLVKDDSVVIQFVPEAGREIYV